MIDKARVLVVEDDEALAKLVTLQLREFDCDVAHAKSGEDALKITEAASSPPDVVIMDVRMPGMDGIECARRLKILYHDVMIIFMTCVVEVAVLERARSVSPTAFILKDIGIPSANSLRAAVRLALDRREAVRHAAQLERSNNRMQRLNMTDELTHLYNRRGFNTLAPRYLKPGRQAILFIDLDNLKTINDTFGHEMGDDALCRFAKILQNVFREDDLIARLSGDEFAVLAAIGEGNIAGVKHRIQQVLAVANLKGDVPYTLDASIGVVVADGGSLADLLSQADAAMYEEKVKRKARASKPTPKDYR
jgi:two-component system cell cycle response regulator